MKSDYVNTNTNTKHKHNYTHIKTPNNNNCLEIAVVGRGSLGWNIFSNN